MPITICAFTDGQPNSVAYKKFDDIDKAVEFYRRQLQRDCVNVISTRKVGIIGDRKLSKDYQEVIRNEPDDD